MPDSDELVISKEISVDFVPHSLTFDPAYESFYATGKSERNVVRLVDLDGSSRELFGEDAEVNWLLQGSDITSIQYEGNTGTLFVLCKECGLVVEVRAAPHHFPIMTSAGCDALRPVRCILIMF